VIAANLLYATSNGPGGNVVLALTPKGETAWHAVRGGAYIASPVHTQGRLYTVNQNCVLSCLAAKDGRLQWQQRLPTTGKCFPSPVATPTAIYIVTTAGELLTIAPTADRFQLLNKLELHEHILASPAISNGTIYLRSDSHLHALLP